MRPTWLRPRERAQTGGTESETMDIAGYRRALGAFATGVCVVTILDEAGVAHGLTVNSFTSVSLDPPLVLWCLGDRSDQYAAFAGAPGYCINILGADQADVAMRFAGKGDQRLAAGEFSVVEGGAPRLAGALASIDAQVTERINAGDHLILLARTTGFAHRDGDALTYFRSRFGAAAEGA
jgi:flavin reductase (DIM6/NTAB) family NADH-FMN oxidoreductase RutF